MSYGGRGKNKIYNKDHYSGEKDLKVGVFETMSCALFFLQTEIPLNKYLILHL